jgi:uncharacterized metal-binding protein YceD (DUF177 family)
MNPLRDYDIAFVGLKEAVHYFDFKIDSSFFALFPDSPLHECDIQVKLRFDKKNSFFLLYFQISGTVKVPCSRCNTPLDYPVDADYNIVVKLGDAAAENKEEDEDVIYLSRSETHLNVAQLLYEFIVLAVPVNRVVCSNIPGKECDPEVLRILSELTENKDNNETDPRWADLKNIKFK